MIQIEWKYVFAVEKIKYISEFFFCFCSLRRSRLQRFDFICDMFFSYRGRIIYHESSHCARMDTKRIHGQNFQGLSLHIGACDAQVYECAARVRSEASEFTRKKERKEKAIVLQCENERNGKEQCFNEKEMRLERGGGGGGRGGRQSRIEKGATTDSRQPTTTKLVRTMATTGEAENEQDKHVEF